MRADLVVLGHPGVEIDLQLVDAQIDLLAKDDAIKLVEIADMILKAIGDVWLARLAEADEIWGDAFTGTPDAEP